MSYIYGRTGLEHDGRDIRTIRADFDRAIQDGEGQWLSGPGAERQMRQGILHLNPEIAFDSSVGISAVIVYTKGRKVWRHALPIICQNYVLEAEGGSNHQATASQFYSCREGHERSTMFSSAYVWRLQKDTPESDLHYLMACQLKGIAAPLQESSIQRMAAMLPGLRYLLLLRNNKPKLKKIA